MPNEELKKLIRQLRDESNAFAANVLAHIDVPDNPLNALTKVPVEIATELLPFWMNSLSAAYGTGFTSGRGIDPVVTAEVTQGLIEEENLQ